MAFSSEINHVVVAKRLDNETIFPALGPQYILYDRPWYKIAYQKFKHKRQQFFPLCLEAIDDHDASIFHSHGGEYGIREMNLKQYRDIFHIVSFYGADIWLNEKDPEWQRKYQDLFLNSDLFMVEGNAMRNKVMELGCPADKVKVHHLGVDLDKIKFAPRAPDRDGTVKVLLAGRSVDKKGHVDAAKVFAKVADKHPQLKLVVMIGGGPDQCVANVNKVKQVIAENGLDERVEWIGLVPFDQYLQQVYDCHILLSPSIRAEDGDAEGGAPVLFTELSASGMPIISTFHCDIPEVVLHETSGLLANEGDLDKLADMLENLVANPAIWNRYAKAGRAHIEKEYNSTIQGERLAAIYRELGQ